MTSPTRDAEQAVQMAWDLAYVSGIDAEKSPKYLDALVLAVRQAERAKIEAEHIERDTVNFAAMLASERRIPLRKPSNPPNLTPYVGLWRDSVPQWRGAKGTDGSVSTGPARCLMCASFTRD